MTYWANREAMGYADPESPWEVPPEPTWSGIIQPFEEWLDKDTGCAWIARVGRESDLEFFVAYQPATPGRGKLTRSRLERVGRFVLPAGEAGQIWEAPAAAAEAIFGAGVRNGDLQVWAMAWEVSAGQPQTVLDPCNTPPPPPPWPGTWPNSLTVHTAQTGFPQIVATCTKGTETPEAVDYVAQGVGQSGGVGFILVGSTWVGTGDVYDGVRHGQGERNFPGPGVPDPRGDWTPRPGTDYFVVSS